LIFASLSPQRARLREPFVNVLSYVATYLIATLSSYFFFFKYFVIAISPFFALVAFFILAWFLFDCCYFAFILLLACSCGEMLSVSFATSPLFWFALIIITTHHCCC